MSSIEEIQPDEAQDLSGLCLEIYSQYYTYLWDDGGAWYMRTRYGTKTLVRELVDPQVRYFWVILEKRKVGYLKINLSCQPKELAVPFDSSGLEIERIYLSKEASGTGLGKKAMAKAETVAIQMGCRYSFLYAMDSSSAVLFYEKLGYAKAGDKRLNFDRMKPEYRDMYLMIKELR